jgi:hypothetical protein
MPTFTSFDDESQLKKKIRHSKKIGEEEENFLFVWMQGKTRADVHHHDFIISLLLLLLLPLSTQSLSLSLSRSLFFVYNILIP